MLANSGDSDPPLRHSLRRGLAGVLAGATTHRSAGKNEDCETPTSRYCFSMILKAIVHEAEEGGFWAEVPSLPGCFTQGETLEELESNVHEAIEGWLLAAEPEITLLSEGKILEVAV
jgi:predicted RNase H-like HicB family nuclease